MAENESGAFPYLEEWMAGGKRRSRRLAQTGQTEDRDG